MSTRFTLRGLADGELIVNGVDMMPTNVQAVTIHWELGEIPRVTVVCLASDGLVVADLEGINISLPSLRRAPDDS